MWDLRKFHSIGKLSGGHQAAVMCLDTGPTDLQDNNYVVTGSKDHYIKVFELPENKGGVIAPKMNLDPPHYDGIQVQTVLLQFEGLTSLVSDVYLSNNLSPSSI